MTRKPATLLEVCAMRAGAKGALDFRAIAKAGRVALFIAEWAIAADKLGRRLTTEEVAAYWKDAERTAYRRLSEFRELFSDLGEHATPQDVLDRVTVKADPAAVIVAPTALAA
jgi:hypothetical protein